MFLSSCLILSFLLPFVLIKKTRKQWFDIDILSAQLRKKCVHLRKFSVTINTDEKLMVAVLDPDLEIRDERWGGGGGPPKFSNSVSSKNKGGGGRGLLTKFPPAKNWTWVNKPTFAKSLVTSSNPFHKNLCYYRVPWTGLTVLNEKRKQLFDEILCNVLLGKGIAGRDQKVI